MLEVLVVDDDSEKQRRIADALIRSGICGQDGIEEARYANAARRRLDSRAFDVVVIDIVLPAMSDSLPTRDAGLRLFADIVEGRFRHSAGHIVGVTTHEEARAVAQGRFQERQWTIIPCDMTSDEWEGSLIARLGHVLRAKIEGQRSSHFETHAAIMCALESPELLAVLRLPWDWRVEYRDGDETRYHLGQCQTRTGPRAVVAAACPRMGMTDAAVLATKLAYTYRPAYVVMPGVCAGVSDEVSVEDLIAVERCWDCGSGKVIEAGGADEFQPAPYQLAVPPEVRSAFHRVSADREFLVSCAGAWTAERKDRIPVLHVGAMGTVGSVMASETASRRPMEQHRKLLGVEMEAYGVFAACTEAARPRPWPVVIKAIVDRGDASKGDLSQQYGAFISAMVARRLVEYELPTRSA